MCRELRKQEANHLLNSLRSGTANPILPGRLGTVGPLPDFEHHAVFQETVTIWGHDGYGMTIPVVVEAWASPSNHLFRADAFVNRSPITGNITIYKSADKYIVLEGCGFADSFSGNHKPFRLWFNVQTPYMPIVTDGKAPVFGFFQDLIKKAVQKATKKIPREKDRSRVKELTQEDAIMDLIPGGADHASGGGKHRFQQRQLFYAVRTPFMERFGFAPEYGYFCKVVTDYANLFGEIRGIYRDPRGVIYHPHRHQEIPLGSLTVENYLRPEWLFNKVLYIEKEGFFSILKDEQWPERHDCALMTSNGQGTRAAKDLIDLLGKTDEPCEFFIIHDADAAGTMIYQCLQEETAARGARNVKIVNLGLEPSEGREMELEVE
jgi:hypothetical protein